MSSVGVYPLLMEKPITESNATKEKIFLPISMMMKLTSSSQDHQCSSLVMK